MGRSCTYTGRIIMSHVTNLVRHIPDLRARRALDLGAGKGNFLLEAARDGIRIQGIEYNPAYVEEARTRLRTANIDVEIIQGKGEELPYEDRSFDFINASEVIEHVQDPERVLREVYRVLAPGGCAYMSVPNRFGMRDPHYKLYFVNWLPRACSEPYIAFFNRSKDDDMSAGAQRLSEMHYFTYGVFKRTAESIGFKVSDIRAARIKEEYRSIKKMLLQAMYPFLRSIYFDSFHLILKKPGEA